MCVCVRVWVRMCVNIVILPTTQSNIGFSEIWNITTGLSTGNVTIDQNNADNSHQETTPVSETASKMSIKQNTYFMTHTMKISQTTTHKASTQQISLPAMITHKRTSQTTADETSTQQGTLPTITAHTRTSQTIAPETSTQQSTYPATTTYTETTFQTTAHKTSTQQRPSAAITTRVINSSPSRDIPTQGAQSTSSPLSRYTSTTIEQQNTSQTDYLFGNTTSKRCSSNARYIL